MWRSEPELDNKPWTTYLEKDDFAGLEMSSVWTTTPPVHTTASTVTDVLYIDKGSNDGDFSGGMTR